MNRKGNPNIVECGKRTRFDGCSAAEANKKSLEAKRRLIVFRDVLTDQLTEEDAVAIANNLIEGAKTDVRYYEVLQAALGQKPSEKQEVELSGSLNLESYLAQFDE